MNEKRVLIGLFVGLVVIFYILGSISSISAAGGRDNFCGSSTYGECETDSDCVRSGCSSQVCGSIDEEERSGNCMYLECYNLENYDIEGCGCVENKCQWYQEDDDSREGVDLRGDDSIDDDSSGRDVFRFKEERTIIDENGVESEIRIEYRERADGRIEQKIKFKSKDGDSEIEVEFEDEIEMEDEIGDDNGINRTKFKVKFKDGKNASVKIMPDTAAARALEVLRLRVCSVENNCTIVLKDVGQRDENSDEIGDDSNGRLRYELKAVKKYRMFGLFEREAEVSAEINADDGEVFDSDRPWWAAFSSEVDEDVSLTAAQ